MEVRRFTFWLAVLFLALGVAGFITPLLNDPLVTDPVLTFGADYARIFTALPTNALYNLLRLAFGVWGLVAADNFISSRAYSRTITVVCAIIAFMGLFPVLNTFFGIMPIFGGNILLNAVIALAAGYYGYVWSGDKYKRPNTKATVR